MRLPKYDTTPSRITIHLSETEIKEADCSRLVDLFRTQSGKVVARLEGSVILVLPRRYRTRQERLSFDHPEVRAFGKSLAAAFPGFSFFLDIGRINTFKQLLLGTMEPLRVLRKGTKVGLSISERGWAIIVERELNAVRSFGEKAMLSTERNSARIAAVADCLNSPKFR